MLKTNIELSDDDLLLLIEERLNEVKIVRRRRVPVSVRLKRKRYYRKKKASLKRKAKLRRRKPRSKRLAKRRTLIKKRMRIKPGSRKRIKLVNSLSINCGLMESKMNQESAKLIRGFSAVIKIAEEIGKDHKKEIKNESISFNKEVIELPQSLGEEFEIDDSLKEMLGIKVNKGYDCVESMVEDARKMIASIAEDSSDLGEASQVLTSMVEFIQSNRLVVTESREYIIGLMKEILLVDAIASELEEKGLSSEVRGELTETIPYFVKEHGGDWDALLDQVPTSPIEKLIAAQDKSFEGKTTVAAIVDEFGDKTATSLALNAIGHGVAMDDDMNVSQFFKDIGVSGRPAIHLDDSFVREVAMEFVDTLETEEVEESADAVEKKPEESPEEEPVMFESKDVIVFDNGGKTFDRYTVFIRDEVYGMSLNPKSPQGFNQFIGSTSDIQPGEHLGKEVSISSLPKDVRSAISDRASEDVMMEKKVIKEQGDTSWIDDEFEITSKVEKFFSSHKDHKDLKLSDQIEIVGENEFGEKIGKLKPKFSSDLKRTFNTFTSYEPYDEYKKEAEQMIEEVAVEKLGKAAEGMSASIDKERFGGYSASIDGNDIDGLFYQNNDSQAMQSVDSWYWMAWFADENSPLFSQDFVDAYDDTEAMIWFKEIMYYNEPSTVDAIVKAASKSIGDSKEDEFTTFYVYPETNDLSLKRMVDEIEAETGLEASIGDSFINVYGVKKKHLGKIKNIIGDSLSEFDEETIKENIQESDPSLRPPKKWADKMMKDLTKKYGEKKAGQVMGDIWYHQLDDKKRSEIRGREGKEYGKAESVVTEQDSILKTPEEKAMELGLEGKVAAEVIGAFADFFDDVDESRSLDFISSEPVDGDGLKKIFSALGGSNRFDPESSLKKVIGVFGPKAKYFPMRQGSIGIYVIPDKRKMNIWVADLTEIDADEVGFDTEKNMFRIWWD